MDVETVRIRKINDIMNSTLKMAVLEASRSKHYPQDVKDFLKGLYATLFLRDRFTARDMEQALFFAYRNGYELGAAAYGAKIEDVHGRFPNFDLDEIVERKAMEDK